MQEVKKIIMSINCVFLRVMRVLESDTYAEAISECLSLRFSAPRRRPQRMMSVFKRKLFVTANQAKGGSFI